VSKMWLVLRKISEQDFQAIQWILGVSFCSFVDCLFLRAWLFLFWKPYDENGHQTLGWCRFLGKLFDRDPLLNLEWNLSGDCGRPYHFGMRSKELGKMTNKGKWYFTLVNDRRISPLFPTPNTYPTMRVPNLHRHGVVQKYSKNIDEIVNL
jgi:hypothetical protein